MHLDLTREQYRNLLDLVYLGNWMVNAVRDPGKAVKKYHDLEQFIFSFAEEEGFGELVEYAAEYQTYFPTRSFEEMLETYQHEYDEENFWEDLVYRLARRDCLRRYGEAAVRRMELKERLEKEDPFLDKYYKETETHGLDRLEIVEEHSDRTSKP